jgi:dephospho-CoA kinase
MRIYGITGGIGSGKSTVAKIFEVLSVPVYYSDERAKEIYHLPEINKKVVDLLGDEAYFSNGVLNKKYISHQIFQNKLLLQQLNEIIHPAVDQDFNEWVKKQNTTFVLKEAAILFETELYKKLNGTILITSPLNIRIERVCKRDGISEDDVKKRIENQFSDEKKATLANWIITNDEEISLIGQSLKIYDELNKS